jgi:heat-inducible transcriptional repressor
MVVKVAVIANTLIFPRAKVAFCAPRANSAAVDARHGACYSYPEQQTSANSGKRRRNRVMNKVTDAVLTERSQQVLKSLIECYVRDGEPVSSKMLVRESQLSLSSASIRNVMADLETLGLIHSPHTSAGRVPTVKGYRLFVDSLVTMQPLDGVALHSLRRNFAAHDDQQDILEVASNLLSGITNMAGIVMLPTHAETALNHIEFLSMSAQRVLCVLVFSNGEIQNRILETARRYQPNELQQVSNFLNEELQGKSISELRKKLLRDLRNTREHIDRLMLEAIDMAQRALDTPDVGPDYLLAGETNLMQYKEMADVERLRELFEAFHEKQTILQLLDQSLRAEGVQIFIGSESGYQVLDRCSVVTASYSVDDKVVGVLGIIGPTRMPYNRVIPIVDITAKLLGGSLKHRF